MAYENSTDKFPYDDARRLALVTAKSLIRKQFSLGIVVYLLENNDVSLLLFQLGNIFSDFHLYEKKCQVPT